MVQHVLVALLLIASASLAQDRLVKDLGIDLDLVLKAATIADQANAIEKLEKLKKELEKKDSKTRERLTRQLDNQRQELCLNESFRDAYRRILLEKFDLPEVAQDRQYPTPSEVAVLVKRSIRKSIEKSYPASLLEKITKKAKRSFRPYQVGDRVNVEINGRRCSGRINRMGMDSVLIGSMNVPRRDLDPRFDRGKMEKMQRDYVQANYHEPREAHLEKLKKKLPPMIYKEHGYVRYNGQWIAIPEMQAKIEQSLEATVQAATEEQAARQERKSQLKKIGLCAGVGALACVLLASIIALTSRSRVKKKRR